MAADTWVTLKRIQELEGTLAECYEWLSKCFCEKEQVSAFFYRLSLDELGHRDLASYQARIVMMNPMLFPAVQVDLASLESVIATIKKFRRESLPSLEETLRVCHDIEAGLAEDYTTTVLGLTHPPMAKLIDSLSEGCKKHHSRIMEFAQQCGVALP
jgi:hypothetical protein